MIMYCTAGFNEMLTKSLADFAHLGDGGDPEISISNFVDEGLFWETYILLLNISKCILRQCSFL